MTDRNATISPLAVDVVFGRGGTGNYHRGTRDYREMVRDQRLRYCTSVKNKQAISKEIVDAIRKKGGRFLQQDENTEMWSVVGDKEAIS